MDEREVDRLLEQALSGGGPPEAFRQHVLTDSTAVLGAGRVMRVRSRTAGLAAAAAVIAAVSFLSGRFSAPRIASQTPVPPAVAHDPQSVSVPTELVAWLDAARFFKQLGMEQRVALAYERAGQLIPRDVPLAENALDRNDRPLVAAAAGVISTEGPAQPSRSGEIRLRTGRPVGAEPDFSTAPFDYAQDKRLRSARNDNGLEDSTSPVKATTAILAHSFGG
ncbi:MAG: hypothetical protein JW993_11685 [Sedimentisphaerales bacterium]|nr:hypothetical protein [Sedimentisphaerales bacterium]